MTYDPAPCSSQCWVTAKLANYLTEKIGGDDVAMFATWATFDLLYDFRDEILAKTATGRRVLELYRRHSDRAWEILSRDPALLVTTLRLLLQGTLFARRVMLAKWRRRTRDTVEVPLDPRVLDQALKLLARFRKRGRGEFDEAVDFAETMLKRIRGVNAPQVWELLQQPPPTRAARRA